MAYNFQMDFFLSLSISFSVSLGVLPAFVVAVCADSNVLFLCPFLCRNLNDSCQADSYFISSPPRTFPLFSRFYFCLQAQSATWLFTGVSLLIVPAPLWTFQAHSLVLL